MLHLRSTNTMGLHVNNEHNKGFYVTLNNRIAYQYRGE